MASGSGTPAMGSICAVSRPANPCVGQEVLSPERAREEQVWLQLRTALG
jgi:hypothetical protein